MSGTFLVEKVPDTFSLVVRDRADARVVALGIGRTVEREEVAVDVLVEVDAEARGE